MITSFLSRKVGISFEVPLLDNLVDLFVIFLVVFVVCFILSKFYSCNLIKFLWSNPKYLPLLNKQAKLFGICLEQLACDNLFITVYWYHIGCILHQIPWFLHFAWQGHSKPHLIKFMTSFLPPVGNIFTAICYFTMFTTKFHGKLVITIFCKRRLVLWEMSAFTTKFCEKRSTAMRNLPAIFTTFSLPCLRQWRSFSAFLISSRSDSASTLNCSCLWSFLHSALSYYCSHLAFHLPFGLGYANCVSLVGYFHQTHCSVDDCFLPCPFCRVCFCLGSLYSLSFRANTNVYHWVQYKLVEGGCLLYEHLFLVDKVPITSILQDQIRSDPPNHSIWHVNEIPKLGLTLYKKANGSTQILSR